MSITEILSTDPKELARRLVEAQDGESAWLDEFATALEKTRAGNQLARILAVWQLNQSQAGSLFGVSRQAVAKWVASGVPTSRVETIADLAAATDLLVRYLQRDRIPAVVRRATPALGGESLLDLVASSRSRDVLDVCRAMFDFSNTHR